MKVALITQARMTSSRFPGKVLKAIKGKTLLQYHIERAQQSGLPVIVATSNEYSDDVVAHFCTDKNIPFFRGSLKNVLERYYQCAKTFHLDQIIRITSDCPLIDGNLVIKGYHKFLKSNCDYLSNTVSKTFPVGFDFEIFTFQTLKKAYENAFKEYEKEHVTPYIWKSHPEKFRIQSFRQNQDKSSYRLTVDMPEDFKLIKILIETYRADQKNYKEIIEILEIHPQLVDINKHIKQIKV